MSPIRRCLIQTLSGPRFSSGTVKRTLSRVAKGVDPAVKTKQKRLRWVGAARHFVLQESKWIPVAAC